MHRLLPYLTGLVLVATPVAAQSISASADHVLWCASAFAQLANDAAEQNDAGDTELYDSLAAALTNNTLSSKSPVVMMLLVTWRFAPGGYAQAMGTVDPSAHRVAASGATL